MFQFPGFASVLRQILCLQHSGLSHSEICGSLCMCHYPQLIAAYHVLHRLSKPRHPPYALCNFFLTAALVFGYCYRSMNLLIYFNKSISRYLSFFFFQYVNELFFVVYRILYRCIMNFTIHIILCTTMCPPPHKASAGDGGEYRIRTDDPLRARQVL